MAAGVVGARRRAGRGRRRAPVCPAEQRRLPADPQPEPASAAHGQPSKKASADAQQNQPCSGTHQAPGGRIARPAAACPAAPARRRTSAAQTQAVAAASAPPPQPDRPHCTAAAGNVLRGVGPGARVRRVWLRRRPRCSGADPLQRLLCLCAGCRRPRVQASAPHLLSATVHAPGRPSAVSSAGRRCCDLGRLYPLVARVLGAHQGSKAPIWGGGGGG